MLVIMAAAAVVAVVEIMVDVVAVVVDVVLGYGGGYCLHEHDEMGVRTIDWPLNASKKWLNKSIKSCSWQLG